MRAQCWTRPCRSRPAVTGTPSAIRCRAARCRWRWRWRQRRRSPAPAQFKGYLGPEASPAALLFEHHGLHIEVRIDRTHPIGRDDAAGIADVQLESALTTIMDLEDSIAAVDSADKVAVYRNWLGLMRGDLTARFAKGGGHVDRKLNADRSYRSPAGGEVQVPGRSLMLVRNVGSSDDDRSHPASGPGGAGRHRRCRGHRADRDDRSEGAGAIQEQPRRLYLHRQAEDARARRGGIRQHAVRSRRRSARARRATP